MKFCRVVVVTNLLRIKGLPDTRHTGFIITFVFCSFDIDRGKKIETNPETENSQCIYPHETCLRY